MKNTKIIKITTCCICIILLLLAFRGCPSTRSTSSEMDSKVQATTKPTASTKLSASATPSASSEPETKAETETTEDATAQTESTPSSNENVSNNYSAPSNSGSSNYSNSSNSGSNSYTAPATPAPTPIPATPVPTPVAATPVPTPVVPCIPGWDEVVVDTAAWTEQVLVTPGYAVTYCNTCKQEFTGPNQIDDVITHLVFNEHGGYHTDSIDPVYQTVEHPAVTHVVHHESSGC